MGRRGSRNSSAIIATTPTSGSLATSPWTCPCCNPGSGGGASLVLGNVEETVPRFFEEPGHPAGRLHRLRSPSVLVLTAHVLRIFGLPGRRTLDHVPLYFDDTEHSISHRFAGELLAIDEFNRASDHVKIDRWRGLGGDRPFPEAAYLRKMYMAHDLRAISARVLDRGPLHRSLSGSAKGRVRRAGPRERMRWCRTDRRPGNRRRRRSTRFVASGRPSPSAWPAPSPRSPCCTASSPSDWWLTGASALDRRADLARRSGRRCPVPSSDVRRSAAACGLGDLRVPRGSFRFAGTLADRRGHQPRPLGRSRLGGRSGRSRLTPRRLKGVRAPDVLPVGVGPPHEPADRGGGSGRGVSRLGDAAAVIRTRRRLHPPPRHRLRGRPPGRSGWLPTQTPHRSVTCAINAHGSSCQTFAAGRHTEWTTIAGGSG